MLLVVVAEWVVAVAAVAKGRTIKVEEGVAVLELPPVAGSYTTATDILYCYNTVP